jgi:hypothetical protein
MYRHFHGAAAVGGGIVLAPTGLDGQAVAAHKSLQVPPQHFGLRPVEPSVTEGGTHMKRIPTLTLLAGFLGGCAIVPLGYGYYGDGYYRGQGYYRGDGYARDYGYYPYGPRGYGYRGRGR